MFSGSGFPLGGKRLFYAANDMNNNMQRRSTINLLKSVLLATILPGVCGYSTESWKRERNDVDGLMGAWPAVTAACCP